MSIVRTAEIQQVELESDDFGTPAVVLANLTEHKGTYRMKDLLPLPFDARLL